VVFNRPQGQHLMPKGQKQCGTVKENLIKQCGTVKEQSKQCGTVKEQSKQCGTVKETYQKLKKHS
jgi:hypothetical protein